MAKKQINKNVHKHRDCAFARDFHDLNYKGEPILCKCDYFPYSMLLSDPACYDNFKLKR